MLCGEECGRMDGCCRDRLAPVKHVYISLNGIPSSNTIESPSTAERSSHPYLPKPAKAQTPFSMSPLRVRSFSIPIN